MIESILHHCFKQGILSFCYILNNLIYALFYICLTFRHRVQVIIIITKYFNIGHELCSQCSQNNCNCCIIPWWETIMFNLQLTHMTYQLMPTELFCSSLSLQACLHWSVPLKQHLLLIYMEQKTNAVAVILQRQQSSVLHGEMLCCCLMR